MEKMELRKLYKDIRDRHPMNDKQTRKYWNSRYITAPNWAGLYIESIQPDFSRPAWYILRQIAKDSYQRIERCAVTVPHINTIPNVNHESGFFVNDWDARQALKFATHAYEKAGNREKSIWHNAHTVTESKDTKKIVTFYCDSYKTSADLDYDFERNQNGERAWTN